MELMLRMMQAGFRPITLRILIFEHNYRTICESQTITTSFILFLEFERNVNSFFGKFADNIFRLNLTY